MSAEELRFGKGTSAQSKVYAEETLAGKLASGMASRVQDIMDELKSLVLEAKSSSLGVFRLNNQFKSEITDIASWVSGNLEERGAGVVIGNWYGPPIRITQGVRDFLWSNGIDAIYRLNIAWGINSPRWI